MPEIVHNLVHNLTCPHCWQAVGIAGVASFAVLFGAVRLWLRRIGPKVKAIVEAACQR